MLSLRSLETAIQLCRFHRYGKGPRIRSALWKVCSFFGTAAIVDIVAASRPQSSVSRGSAQHRSGLRGGRVAGSAPTINGAIAASGVLILTRRPRLDQTSRLRSLSGLRRPRTSESVAAGPSARLRRPGMTEEVAGLQAELRALQLRRTAMNAPPPDVP